MGLIVNIDCHLCHELLISTFNIIPNYQSSEIPPTPHYLRSLGAVFDEKVPNSEQQYFIADERFVNGGIEFSSCSISESCE